jgi:hypothetical protein
MVTEGDKRCLRKLVAHFRANGVFLWYTPKM